MNIYKNLTVVPLELPEANQVVSCWHRHHQPIKFHRYSLGVIDELGVVRGAAIVGRPVARNSGHQRDVLEVSRLATDGTPNAASMLYGAAARIGKENGYLRIQTYILQEEIGTTLKAAGWQYEGIAGGGQWARPDGKPRRTDQPIGKKQRWAKILNAERSPVIILPSVDDYEALSLGLG